MNPRTSAMSHQLFTYGSLMYPQVWQRVVRGMYRSVAAVVAGHARYGIIGETYPAMVEQADAVVSGVVYLDVDENDVARLDVFEGNAYQRTEVAATLSSGDILTVDAYIYLDKSRLSDALWTPETFQLQRFLETTCYKPDSK